MRTLPLVFVGLLVPLAIGCSDKNPVAPGTTAAPVATGLVIAGVDAVLTGVSATYSATATLSDGSTRTVSPAWTSTNPDVASIDNAGRVDGRSHGTTTLTASYAGREASKTVHVINNYGGTWNGRYVVSACAASGDLTDHDGGWCLAGPGRVGTVGSIGMALSQSGSDLSDITGTLGVNEGGGTITGTVTPDGGLRLDGSFQEWDWDGEVILSTLQIRGWATNLAGPGVMTGRWSQGLTTLYFRLGQADTENELVTMTRVSTAVVTPSASTGVLAGIPR